MEKLNLQDAKGNLDKHWHKTIINVMMMIEKCLQTDAEVPISLLDG